MKKLLLLFIIVIAGCSNPNEIFNLTYKIRYKASCTNNQPATVRFSDNNGNVITKEFTKEFEYEMKDRHDAEFYIYLSVLNGSNTGYVKGSVILNTSKEIQIKQDSTSIDISGTLRQLKKK